MLLLLLLLLLELELVAVVVAAALRRAASSAASSTPVSLNSTTAIIFLLACGGGKTLEERNRGVVALGAPGSVFAREAAAKVAEVEVAVDDSSPLGSAAQAAEARTRVEDGREGERV